MHYAEWCWIWMMLEWCCIVILHSFICKVHWTVTGFWTQTKFIIIIIAMFDNVCLMGLVCAPWYLVRIVRWFLIGVCIVGYLIAIDVCMVCTCGWCAFGGDWCMCHVCIMTREVSNVCIASALCHEAVSGMWSDSSPQFPNPHIKTICSMYELWLWTRDQGHWKVIWKSCLVQG